MNKKTGNITYAYLETTNYCNLDCSFCNRNEVIGKLKHMPLEQWATLLDKIKHHPLQEAKLMGMGEPFLHPEWDVICEMFKKVFPDCKIIVATNCQYRIDEGLRFRKKFENALKHIDMLYFSIDGYKEHYERDRAPAKWNKLINFLENFKNIDRQNCNVVVNYVVNTYNVFDIPKVDELRKKYNLGRLRLNIAQCWSENESISEKKETYAYSEEQIRYLKENWQDRIMGKSKWDYEDCFWVKNGLYTTVDGNVLACCMNTGAKPFGNIFTESIENIHSADSFQNVKSGCSSNNPNDHCKNCSYKELVPILSELGVQN